MARPVNADAADTRARVLRAAGEHFARRGLDATSLREVARDAGVTVATLSYYFGGKRELYGACIDAAYADAERRLSPLARKFEELGRVIAEAAASPGPRKDDALGALVERLTRDGMRFGRAEQGVLRMLMRTVLETGELDPRWRDRRFVPFLVSTARLLAEHTGRPELELRMDLQALVALGLRYSLSSPRELALLAGLAREDEPIDAAREEAAIRAFEDHVVRLARRLLAP